MLLAAFVAVSGLGALNGWTLVTGEVAQSCARHGSLPPAFAALPEATPLRVSVALDPATLPGALRLPALFEPAWRFTAADYTWRMP